MPPRNKFDQTRWKLERDRFRLTDPAPPRPEPDLSLRPAITRIFTKLDSQAGSGIHKIQTKWKIIAGEAAAGHSRPGRLAGDILYVYVDSSSWLAEITRFYSENILRKIQDEIGPGTVKGLRFQVSPPGAG